MKKISVIISILMFVSILTSCNRTVDVESYNIDTSSLVLISGEVYTNNEVLIITDDDSKEIISSLIEFSNENDPNDIGPKYPSVIIADFFLSNDDYEDIHVAIYKDSENSNDYYFGVNVQDGGSVSLRLYYNEHQTEIISLITNQ